MCPVSVPCYCIPDNRHWLPTDGDKILNATLDDTSSLVLSYHCYAWHGLPLRHADAAGLK